MGHYQRFVSFGLGRHNLKSAIPSFDRRGKKEFRKWRRLKEKREFYADLRDTGLTTPDTGEC
jgi:hypothetical protein